MSGNRPIDLDDVSDTRIEKYEFGTDKADANYDLMMTSHHKYIHVCGFTYYVTDIVWLTDTDEWALVAWEAPVVSGLKKTRVLISHTMLTGNIHSGLSDTLPYEEGTNTNDRYAVLKELVEERQLFFHAKGGLYRLLDIVWSLDFGQWVLIYLPMPKNFNVTYECEVMFARTDRNFFEIPLSDGRKRFTRV